MYLLMQNTGELSTPLTANLPATTESFAPSADLQPALTSDLPEADAPQQSTTNADMAAETELVADPAMEPIVPIDEPSTSDISEPVETPSVASASPEVAPAEAIPVASIPLDAPSPASPYYRLTTSDATYGLLVDKESARLFLYEVGRPGEPLRVYRCATGKNKGAKQVQGDRKTPVGLYYMTSIKEDEELPERYGVRAFVMDYPNPFDAIEGKNGYGIWLHATDEPDREKLPNITDGCVVLNNEDILDISQYITLNKTPILIVDNIESLNTRQISLNEDTVELWRQDWESQNLDDYIQWYSGDFRGKVGRRYLSRRRWHDYKTQVQKKNTWQKIQTTDISLLQMQDYAIVNFQQHFQSDQFTDIGYKRLYWKREAEGWRIVRETWYPLEDDPVMAAKQNDRD